MSRIEEIGFENLSENTTIMQAIVPLMDMASVPLDDQEVFSEGDLNALSGVFYEARLEQFWIRYQGYAATFENQISLLARFRVEVVHMANHCLSLPIDEGSEEPWQEAINYCKTWISDRDFSEVKFDAEPEYETSSELLTTTIPFINFQLASVQLDHQPEESGYLVMTDDCVQFLEAVFQQAQAETRWLVVEETLKSSDNSQSARLQVMQRFAVMCNNCLDEIDDGGEVQATKICSEWFDGFSLSSIAQEIATETASSVDDAIKNED